MSDNKTNGYLPMNGEVKGHNIPYADSDDELEEDSADPQRKLSLAERRNQNIKLTVVIENEKNNIKEQLDEENKDKPGPLAEEDEKQIGRMRGLRRNSISMPTLNANDLDALRQAHMDHEANQIIADDNGSIGYGIDAGSQISGISTVTDLDIVKNRLNFSEDDDPPPRTLFRNKRRLSVAPLPALRLNDKEMMANEFDSQSVLSNQNSITSINSLASLLKEKMQMFPAMIKKRKKATKDYKLRVFVGMLFLIIVFLIGYAYVMYNQQVLARSYFENVKFNKENRKIRIFDSNGSVIITGLMGTTINLETLFHCLPENKRDDGSVCWEWDNKARLYMNFAEAPASDIRCYSFKWQALSEGVYPTDCFDISEENGFWYGGGLTKGVDYPLGKGSFDFAPFVTGDSIHHQWGNAVKRYFINSRGVAIQVDDRTPLYVSLNKNNSNQFCLRAKNDNFAYVNRFTEFPELNYRICTAPLLKLHHGLTQKSLWDGMKLKATGIIHSLLDEPVWQIPASGVDQLSEASIYNYTEDVIALGFLGLGHVLINEFWQKNIGDFKLDEERFPTLEDTVNILHRRGFTVALTIQPFISTESPNFAEAVAKKILIFERSSEKNIPALTSYKSLASAGVLDITNNATLPWLLERLEKVVKTYQIDSFYLDYGTAFDMPRYYQCSSLLDNPDQYKTIFTNSLNEAISIIGVSGAISIPRPPTFLNMPPVDSSWSGLQTIIPTLLSYGIIEFPFIMPGPVGGDFLLPPKNATKLTAGYISRSPPLPDKELYIRWLQLATFLPVLRFSHLPSEFKNDFVTDVAKELTAIRQKTVTPLLKKYLDDAMDEGKPLIRPLWMLDTQDVNCLYIDDEFSVGKELIVAPILHKGETIREVYLPQGVWKDGIDGSLRKGSRWIHNYRVPEDKVAYFVKMPNNTRF